MTPAEIAELTDPKKIRNTIQGKELALRLLDLTAGQRATIKCEIAALEERYLEVVGEPWRP